MRFDWRGISGAILTVATASTALLLDGGLPALSALAPLFVCIAAFSAALSGVLPGLICAVIAVAFTASFAPDPGPAPDFDAARYVQTIVLAIVATVAAVITG